MGGLGDRRGDPEFAKNEQKDNYAEHLGPLPLSKLSQSAPKPDFGSPEGSRGSSWRPRDSISGGLFGISLGLLHGIFVIFQTGLKLNILAYQPIPDVLFAARRWK